VKVRLGEFVAGSPAGGRRGKHESDLNLALFLPNES
jgi:hypothetical protein